MCCDTSSETHVQRGEQTYTSASLAWGLHLASSGLSSVTAVGMSWERNTSRYRRSYLPRGSTKARSHFFPCSLFSPKPAHTGTATFANTPPPTDAGATLVVTKLSLNKIVAQFFFPKGGFQASPIQNISPKRRRTRASFQTAAFSPCEAATGSQSSATCPRKQECCPSMEQCPSSLQHS